MSDPRDPTGGPEEDSVLLLPGTAAATAAATPAAGGEAPAASGAAGGSSRLDDLVASVRVVRWRQFAWIVMFLIAGFAGWAYSARLDEVATAVGEVVPQENIKVVQHLEGGIIRQIHVREGQLVKAGEPLVSLDLGALSMNEAELQVQYDALALQRARLEAEATGDAPDFPEDVVKRRPDLVRSERASLVARRAERETGLDAQRKQVVQREQAVKELRSGAQALRTDLRFARQALKMSRDLLDEGLTAKIEHLKREREVKRLEGQLVTLRQSIPRAEAALAEARARLSEEEQNARRLALEELTKVEQSIARTLEFLGRATAQARRAEIKSPIDGVVKNLRQHTIGGIVRAGEPIMEIVPSEQNLIIEAKLSPVDRGYVEVGYPVQVKITTYEFIRYGGLDGEVIHIAADANTDPSGNPYFRVFVKTKKAYLGKTFGDLPITPGMQAVVDIQTGSRSVMEYLLRPVLKLKHEAFRER
ncbi:MAG: HlyD family type I secretion periplasmic adaptor subunit [Rhodospirillales bacterium]